MSKKLESKAIHMSLKRNETTDEMMKKFGYASQQELYDSLHNAFPRWASKVIAELRKNDKVSAKSRIGMHSAEKVLPRESTEDDMPLIEELSTTTDADDNHTTNVVSGTGSFNLEDLLGEEKKLSDYCIELEKKHKELVTSRADCVHKLQECRTAIEKMQQAIQAQREQVNSILATYDNLADEMSGVSEEISAARTALENVRTKIFIAKRATIYVFSDGSIEVENATLPSNLEINDISPLVQRPEAEELTIREIKAVAKLIQVIEWLKSKKIQFELSFDSQEVQSLYEAVMV